MSERKRKIPTTPTKPIAFSSSMFKTSDDEAPSTPTKSVASGINVFKTPTKHIASGINMFSTPTKHIASGDDEVFSTPTKNIASGDDEVFSTPTNETGSIPKTSDIVINIGHILDLYRDRNTVEDGEQIPSPQQEKIKYVSYQEFEQRPINPEILPDNSSPFKWPKGFKEYYTQIFTKEMMDVLSQNTAAPIVDPIATPRLTRRGRGLFRKEQTKASSD